MFYPSERHLTSIPLIRDTITMRNYDYPTLRIFFILTEMSPENNLTKTIWGPPPKMLTEIYLPIAKYTCRGRYIC